MEEGKFYKQRGFWPFITFWGGTFFAIYMGLAYIWLFTNLFVDFEFRPFGFYVILLFAFSMTTSFGMGLAGSFPEIRIVDAGIEYRSLRIFGGLILWEEAEWIISSKNQKIFGIIINRKGYSRLNSKGLFFNEFYGQFVEKRGTLTLLLSDDMDNFDEVIREIKAHVKPSLVSKERI